MKAPENLSKWFSFALAGIALAGAIWTGIEKMDSALGELATKEDISVLRSEIQANRSAIDTMKGLDDVTQFREESTYVREPVFTGQPIEFNAVVRRTLLGTNCIMENLVPLFEDNTRRVIPGEERVATQQIGSSYVPIRLEFDVPEDIQPGRVTIRLQFKYTCNGESVMQTTTPVAFYISEGEE